MKTINYAIGIISALAGIIFIIYLGINTFLVQDSFLNYTNEKYGIAESLSMEEADLRDAVHAMISYVKGGIEDAQIVVPIAGEDTEFFNEKELTHLTDVRDVLALISKIAVTSLFVCVLGEIYLVLAKDENAVIKGVKYAWILMLVAVFVIGVIAMDDINKIVVGFHELFFTNDLWLLNPATDRSVWMFKNEMYSDALVRIAGIVGATAVATLGGTVLIKKKNLHEK